MFFCILAGNAWGRGLFFYNNIVEFDYNSSTPAWESNCNLTMTHISSDSSSDTYEVAQDVMWEWAPGYAPNNMADITSTKPGANGGSVQDVEFYWSLDVSGSGITIPNDFIQNHVDNHYELIQDKDHGHRVRFTLASNATSGSIRVTVLQPDFEDPNTHEHSTYSATYTIKINQKIPSKNWNFYSNQMAIGRSVDTSKPLYAIKNSSPSVLKKETTTGFDTEGTNALFWYNTGLTANATTGEDFIFHYNNSNSYTVPEAAGLKFYAPAGKIGIANDEDVAGASQFRYIALKPGAKVIVPKSTWSSWPDKSNLRVRVKMGRYGADSEGVGIVLDVHNATDALGQTIVEHTYKIGGCAWWGGKGDNNQRGEYHFNITSADADFAIEVYSGQWLELYSIEVYSSTDMITENNLLGDKYQLLNIDGSGAAAAGTYYLHYRGKGETTEIDPIYTTTTGTVSSPSFTNADNVNHTYTSTPGQFGTFRIRMKCRTMYYSGHQYCTDYAWRTMSVGYRETQTYPYTWDFADVHTYKYTDGYKLDDGRMGTEGSYYWDSDLKEQRLWLEVDEDKRENNPSAIQLASDGGHNVNYCGGSQLWYGTTMIPESKGLGFTPVNYDYVYNSSLTIQEGSIKFHQGMRDWWGWRVTVPSVPANGAVYVRAKEIGTPNLRHVKFWIKDVGDVVSNKTKGETDFYDSEYSSETYHNKVLVEGSSDEYIYAIYNNDETNAKDITLFFNEVEVKKIAVSTDLKTFNALGWTTESRDHDIDPSLTAEMNGRNITTYLVTGVNYDKKVVTMTDISNAGLMHSASDGDKYACILRNTADEPLEVVNGGFYLFVPDMHDKQGSTVPTGEKTTDWNKKNYAPSMESSVMKAKVSHAYPANYPNDGDAASGTRIPWKEGDYTNFAFTYQYYTLENGYTTGSVKNGPQGFYRIAKDGGYSLGNQGYLPLETSKIGGDVWAGARGFGLSFDEDEGGEVTAIESIDTIDSHATAETAIYYSLSGQKLNGKPAKGGIYICNGKKIAIK